MLYIFITTEKKLKHKHKLGIIGRHWSKVKIMLRQLSMIENNTEIKAIVPQILILEIFDTVGSNFQATYDHCGVYKL